MIVFSGSIGSQLAADLSPDQKWLAASQIFSPVLTLWSTETKEVNREFPKLKGAITEVAFSKDSKRVAARCPTSNEVVIWDRESGKEIARKTSEGTDLKELLLAL